MAIMSRLSEQPMPGCILIYSQPKPQHIQEYQDWYNTEHGPLRMKLDFIQNGYRYKSMNKQDKPVFLALYDVGRLSGLDEPRYTKLRAHRSTRESELIDNKLEMLDRRIYRAISSRGDKSGPAPVAVVVTCVVKDSLVDEINRWYEEEHTHDLTRIPGWRRSRRFQLVESKCQKEGYTELLAIHDFDHENGLGGQEHELAKSKPRRRKVMDMVEKWDNQKFEFFHEFHAADYRDPVSIKPAMNMHGS